MPDGTKIDSLLLEVSADSSKATDGFDKVEKSLSKLSHTISSFNPQKITEMATGMEKLSTASASLGRTLNGLSFGKLVTDADRLNYALNQSANAMANAYGVKGKKAVGELRDSLSKLYSTYDKHLKFGNAQSAYDFQAAMKSASGTLADNVKKVDESEEAYVRLARAVEAANSASLKTGSKIHLPQSIKEEYKDDYDAMRKSLGQAFTTTDQKGKGTDFETWLGELNSQLGGIIDMSHGAEEAFGNFVEAVARGKKAQEVSGRELFDKGLLNRNSVEWDLAKEVGNIKDIQDAMKETGKDGIVAQGEASQFDILIGRIREVVGAVHEKTQAFQEEATTVSKVVKSEIGVLTALGKKIHVVSKQAHTVGEAIRDGLANPKDDDLGLPLSNGKNSEPMLDSTDVEQTTESTEKLGEEEEKASESAKELGSSHEQASGSVSNFGRIATVTASAVAKLTKKFAGLTIKGAGTLVAKEAKAFGSLGKSLLGSLVPGFNKARSSHNGFMGSMKTGIMTALKYGLGIRSLFVLFNKLRSAMVAGFGNLSQYSADTKANLDSLSTGLSSLQNALAVAFNPILEIVTPILSTLIDYAIAAANAIAMLFAVLSGGGTYIKAKRIASGMGAIGGAASGAGGAVKELKRELLGFDEITKLQDDSSGGGGGGGGGGGAGGIGDMFDTEQVSADMKSFAEKLKEAWELADFTEIGEIIGTKLKDGLDRIPWDEIQTYADDIGRMFATAINGFVEVEGLGDSIGNTIGEAFNTALTGTNTFLHTLHFDSIGTFVADAIDEAIAVADFEKIGYTVASGINGVFSAAKSFSERFDFKHLASQVSTAVNTALTGIVWEDAFDASFNFGKGIADFLNGTITEETFSNIGSTIANLFNTVVIGAMSFADEAEWEQYGTAIGSGINKFVSTFDWTKAGLTLNKLALGIISSLKTAIKTVEWDDVGTKIGEAIKALDFTSILEGVGSLIWEAIKAAFSAWKGAFDASPIETAILTAVGLLKFTGLGSKISSLIFTSIKNAVIGKEAQSAATEIGTAIENTLTHSSLVAKVTSMGETIKTGVTSAFSVLSEGTLIGSIAIAGEKLGEFFDKVHGGNGSLTELGGALDSVTSYMTANHEITSKQNTELFNLKEAMEDNGFSAQDYATKLSECGVSAETFESAIMNSGLAASATEEQISFLNDVVVALGDSAEDTASRTAISAMDQDEAYKKIRQAIIDTGKETGDADLYVNNLLDTFTQVYADSGDVETAFKAVTDEMNSMGLETDTLKGNIEKNIPNAFGTVSRESLKAKESLETLSSKLSSLPTDKQLKIQAILDDNSLSFNDKRIQVLAELTGISQETLRRDQRKVDELWGNLDEVIDKTNGKAKVDKVTGNLTDTSDNIPDVKKVIGRYKASVDDAKEEIPTSKKTTDAWKAFIKYTEDKTPLSERISNDWFAYMKKTEDKIPSSDKISNSWEAYMTKKKDNLSSDDKKITGFTAGMTKRTLGDAVKNPISVKANMYKRTLADAVKNPVSVKANMYKRTLADAVKNPISVKANMYKRTLSDTVKNSVNLTANFNKKEYSAGTWLSGFTADITKKQDSIPWYEKVISGFKAIFTGKGGASTGGIYTQGRWSPVTSHADGGILKNGVWNNLPKFANGGVLGTTGQMFVAREAGPELVGTIGSHTAVMNNDQIVGSVARGVYEATLAAMRASGNNRNVSVNVSLEGDARGIFRVVQRENNKIVQSTGRPALMV